MRASASNNYSKWLFLTIGTIVTVLLGTLVPLGWSLSSRSGELSARTDYLELRLSVTQARLDEVRAHHHEDVKRTRDLKHQLQVLLRFARRLSRLLQENGIAVPPPQVQAQGSSDSSSDSHPPRAPPPPRPSPSPSPRPSPSPSPTCLVAVGGFCL